MLILVEKLICIQNFNRKTILSCQEIYNSHEWDNQGWITRPFLEDCNYPCPWSPIMFTVFCSWVSLPSLFVNSLRALSLICYFICNDSHNVRHMEGTLGTIVIEWINDYKQEKIISKTSIFLFSASSSIPKMTEHMP